MFYVNTVVGKIVLMLAITHNVISGMAKFRILAPEFICPRGEEPSLDKPDNTIITVKTESSNILLEWSVRWKYLPTPSQRFTLLLWRTVRALEAKLNEPQPEPFVYVIDNTELLKGVSYIFNVTAIEGDYENSKVFEIDNTQGDQMLVIEGRSDKFSVILVGGQVTYTDMEYILEAQVTTCHQTQDYYFVWTIYNLKSNEAVNISEVSGCLLKVPAYSLEAGLSYDVRCQLYRHSTGDFITQTSLPLQVQYRGMEVNLNVDFLIVPTGSPFILEALLLFNHDYFQGVQTFEWSCMYDNETCEEFESIDQPTLFFSRGLSNKGRYEISLTVNVEDQTISTNATVIVTDEQLPLLQIDPVPRILNAGSVTSLVANATNVAPSCKLTWYFASLEILASSILADNSTCDSCQHGDPLSDSLTIYSLEENFLNELTDFSNETEWRQVTAQLDAAAGRARLVAQCGCSLTFSCDTEGTLYADISFLLNTSPKAKSIIVSPDSGLALETVYRISTLAAIDEDPPLRYNFYTGLGINSSLLLASYIEHLAVETLLPYIDGTSDVWVEVCDSFGACSSGDHKSVQVLSGEARTIDALIDDVTAYVRRCEMTSLKRVVVTTVATFKNAGQYGALSVFASALLAVLPMLDNNCINSNSEQYSELIHWLGIAGISPSS